MNRNELCHSEGRSSVPIEIVKQMLATLLARQLEYDPSHCTGNHVPCTTNELSGKMYSIPDAEAVVQRQ